MRCGLTLALFLSSCAAVPVDSVPLTGDWGGPHVALHLTAGGGTLDYDCAHGTIGPIIPRADGSFTAQGTHTREHGGPVREGEVLPTLTARYDGHVRGNRMTIGAVTSNEFALGPFELRRGVQPMLTRCL
jgi:hypothetical protein